MEPLNTSQLSGKIIPNIPQCLPGYHWDYTLLQCVANNCQPGYHWDASQGRCVADNPSIIVVYAGVSITYETTNHILKFSNVANINTVLDQLDADYENYNVNYENQYPTLTADQLDSVDLINNFDQLKKFKDFEGLFSAYTSKRSQLETVENTWLTNNFTGTDPDTLNYTIDDAENAIFNNSYQLKIGTDTYEMREDGLYLSGGFSPASLSACFTNKTLKKPYFNTDNTRMFKLKVAIHSILIRTSAKGKVVSFRKKNNKWKRSRYDLSVSVAGNLYGSDCATLTLLSQTKPTSGYKKRNELKVVKRDYFLTYRTKSTELGSRFDTPDSHGSLILN